MMAESQILKFSSSKYPWDLIEMDYRAGVIPLSGICNKYGVSRVRLETVAAEYGWVRKVFSAEEMYGEIGGSVDPGSVVVLPSDARRVAMIQAASIIGSHRKDIAKARMIMTELYDRLIHALDGDPKFGTDRDGEEIMLPYSGPRESPADLLEKLSRIMVRVIGLERQSFGLDVLIDPNDASVGVEVEEGMAAILDRLDRIAATKAGR